MKTQSVKDMNKLEIEKYLYNIQDYILMELDSGKDIDSILDKTNIFDEFEEVLPDEEYPVFVITILNNIRSKDIINQLIDSIQNNKEKYVN